MAGSSQASWLSSSSSTGGGRFAPGEVVGGRYRIIGLLGRGGMGEVYRADDLTLDQPVALKFLPEALARSEDRRARFLGEVRTARQVTHPNVCRVHDIGEIDGLLYLSMEYVDGEDLSSLLRRIGRLPGDKAIEIARQLCAGLAAAHDKGVLHRDLKPANVMIDGQGKVRLTDFGLASAIRDIEGGEVRAGTPAYMSPEQLTGKEVTVRSDIYALGLVLYELITGRRAFDAETLGELTSKHASEIPDSPSSIRPLVDPSVEAIVMRCLEKDPGARPASALAVAAALPGGDPLAAALAAGETPSPALVAAAGGTSAVAPRVAWTLLVGFLGLLIVYAAFAGRSQIFPLLSPDRSPEVLAAQSRDLLGSLGYTERPADTAFNFTFDGALLNRILREKRGGPDYWRPIVDAHPQPIWFWYRESPRRLESQQADGLIRFGTPPLELSGMARVRLDMSGRLLGLTVVPPQIVPTDSTSTPRSGTPSADVPATDPPAGSASTQAPLAWTPLFERAGLDMTRFTEIDPVWTPEVYADQLRSWRGTYAEAPEETVRVDAAAFRGRPVHFDVVGSWEGPSRQVEPEIARGFEVAQALSATILGLVVIFALVLARRNLRLGRGDPRGAFRLALLVTALGVIGWAISAHHPTSPMPFISHTFDALGSILFNAALVWIVYVSLEPYVRKRWPHRIVTWSRLLDGRVRDPQVGRDILVGCAVGVIGGLIDVIHVLVPPELGVGGALPIGTIFRTMLGANYAIDGLLSAVLNALVNGLVFIFFPLLLYLVFRKELIGVVVFGLMIVAMNLSRSPIPAIAFGMGGVQVAMWLALMMRGGLLPLTVNFYVYFVLALTPVTLSLGTWYSASTLVVLVTLAGLGLYGFLGATRGQVAAPVRTRPVSMD